MMKFSKRKAVFPVLTSILVPHMVMAGDVEKPNVVLIYADDIGYGDLGWLGATTVNTPNVNTLADEGIRFTNCHSTSSVSTPSRYGMLTGMYPWRVAGTGIAPGDAAMIIKPEQYTIADMFKKSGYTTAAIGKWHLGLGGERGKQEWNGKIEPGLSDLGFDYSYIMAATGDRVPCVFIENGKVDNLDPADPIEVSYSKPFDGEPTGKNNPELLRMHPSVGHNMAIVNGIPRIGYMKGGKSALWRDEDIADDITRKAVKFIQNNQNTPFFLYFATNDIHVPRIPHERFVGKSGMGPRGDAILSFDYCVGRIMETLDSLKLADNTIIILTSDNGPVLDDGYHDQAKELVGTHKPAGIYRGWKCSVFEGGTRVPMIVRWPQEIKSSKTSDALISQIDFFKSFADYLGTILPEGVAPDSENIWKTLTGKNKKGRKELIEQSIYSTLSLVTPRYKYIEPNGKYVKKKGVVTEAGDSMDGQLYDLKKDPVERNNIASSKKSLTDKMRAALEKKKAPLPQDRK